MTLTYFMARSTWVAYAFEWGKLLKCHLNGKISRKLANGQNIDYTEKRKWPKGFICPCTGVKYHNIQTSLLAQLSRRLTGELIVYPCSGVRRPSVRRPHFQRSSPLKPLGQSKPNFIWSILRKVERKFV